MGSVEEFRALDGDVPEIIKSSLLHHPSQRDLTFWHKIDWMWCLYKENWQVFPALSRYHRQKSSSGIRASWLFCFSDLQLHLLYLQLNSNVSTAHVFRTVLFESPGSLLPLSIMHFSWPFSASLSWLASGAHINEDIEKYCCFLLKALCQLLLLIFRCVLMLFLGNIFFWKVSYTELWRPLMCIITLMWCRTMELSPHRCQLRASL